MKPSKVIVRRPSYVTLLPASLAALLLTESRAAFRLEASAINPRLKRFNAAALGDLTTLAAYVGYVRRLPLTALKSSDA